MKRRLLCLDAKIGCPIILAIPLLASGCASFDGAPKPVLASATMDAIVAQYQPETAMQKINGMKADEQKQYRNKVIAIYIAAADARYQVFRTQLSNETKGTNTAIGIGVIGTATAASLLSGGTANALAAAAASLSGTQALLAKEVYFQRTLPAMIDSMNAARDRVRAQIYTNMVKPVSDYPLEAAFGDLFSYEMAASIDGALQQISAQAAKDATSAANDLNEAKINFNQAIDTKPLTPLQQTALDAFPGMMIDISVNDPSGEKFADMVTVYNNLSGLPESDKIKTDTTLVSDPTRKPEAIQRVIQYLALRDQLRVDFVNGYAVIRQKG